MLELITIRQVGPRFFNSSLCKMPCNAKKSSEHSKRFYLLQTQPSDASGIDLAWRLPHVDSCHVENM